MLTAPASLGRRGLAYLLDALPVSALVAGTYFLCMPEAWEAVQAHLADRSDSWAHAAFLDHRNNARDLSGVALILYGTVLESSALEGTLGKRLLGLRVHHASGERLSLNDAFVRNVARLFGGTVAVVGFLWALRNPQRQGLHDRAVDSLVLVGTGPAEDQRENLRSTGSAWKELGSTLLLGWLGGAVVWRLVIAPMLSI